MSRLLVTAVLFAATGLAAGQEKKAEAPTLSGRWVKEADGLEMTAEFAKGTLTLVAKKGDDSVTVTSKYSVEKGGKVKAEVTAVKETGSFQPKPEKGTTFTFTFKVDEKAKTATLSDFEMPGAEGVGRVVDGEYKEKKAD